MAYVFGSFALAERTAQVIPGSGDLGQLLGVAFENRNGYQFVKPESASASNASLAFLAIDADVAPIIVGAIATGRVGLIGVPGSAKAWVDAAVAAGNVVLVNTLSLQQGIVSLAVMAPDARARALIQFVPQTATEESVPPPRWAVLAAGDAAIAKLGAASNAPMVPAGYVSRNPDGSCTPPTSPTSIQVTLANGDKQTLPVCMLGPCGTQPCAPAPKPPAPETPPAPAPFSATPVLLGLGLLAVVGVVLATRGKKASPAG